MLCTYILFLRSACFFYAVYLYEQLIGMTRPMVVLCACVTSFIAGHSLPCIPLFSNLDAAAIRRPADHDWTDLPTH